MSQMERFSLYLAQISTLLFTVLLGASVVFASPGLTVTDSTIVTHHDTIPRFCGPLRATVNSVKGGAWNDPTVWSTGSVPGSGARVAIQSGHSVSYAVVNNTALDCVEVRDGGVLSFATGSNTKLVVGSIIVLEDGRMTVGTEGSPVSSSVTAEIVIDDLPLDTILDPSQWGTSFLVFGDLKMHGAPLSDTFVRTTSEPKLGDTVLNLEKTVTGWRAGDRIIIPETRTFTDSGTSKVPRGGPGYVPQYEERILAGSGSNSITLAQSLQYDHNGARDGDGTLEFLPHVMNMSRNVIIRSETLAEAGKSAWCEGQNKLNDTANCATRGHTTFLHRAKIDVRYVAFNDLGRTINELIDNTTYDGSGNPTAIGANQIARYAIHTHHLFGPVAGQTPANGYQYTLLGNAIGQGSAEHKFKWAIAIHGSHYGLIKDNTAYNIAGSAIVAEDGSESYNVFDHNMVVRAYSRGSGWRFSTSNGLRDAREANGFWFRGPLNYVRNNVAANIVAYDQPDTSYGFKYLFEYLGNVTIPVAQGDDAMLNGKTVYGNGTPVVQFQGNEVYGATESALTYWWVCSAGSSPTPNCGPSLIKDTTVWHINNKGIFHYPSSEVVIENWTQRGVPGAACCRSGIFFPDYTTHKVVVKNPDIQGMGSGIVLPENAIGRTVVDGGYLRNMGSNISAMTHFNVNGTSLAAKSDLIKNVDFEAWPGFTPVNIATNFRTQATNLIQDNGLFVINYDLSGQDYKIYREQQAASFVVMESGSNTSGRPTVGAPPGDVGLTNQQLLAKYPDGVNVYGNFYRRPVIFGEIARCEDVVAGIDGFACPLQPGDLLDYEALAKFDFGRSTTPVEAGHQQITEATGYTAAQGFGWQFAQSGTIAAGSTNPDAGPIWDDWNYSSDGDAAFAVDVPNGKYVVSVAVRREISDQGVFFEGVQVGTMNVARYRIGRFSYSVTVTDGQINVMLRNMAGGGTVAIGELKVTPWSTSANAIAPAPPTALRLR